jgi:hypothetical protein
MSTIRDDKGVASLLITSIYAYGRKMLAAGFLQADTSRSDSQAATALSGPVACPSATTGASLSVLHSARGRDSSGGGAGSKPTI